MVRPTLFVNWVSGLTICRLFSCNDSQHVLKSKLRKKSHHVSGVARSTVVGRCRWHRITTSMFQIQGCRLLRVWCVRLWTFGAVTTCHHWDKTIIHVRITVCRLQVSDIFTPCHWWNSDTLTPSTPAFPNCSRSKGQAPHWSNPPVLIFDIRALWRSVLSARAPECQKLKMVG